MRPFSTPLGRWLGVMALAAVLATPALAQRTVSLRMNSATLPDTIKADTDLAGAEIRGQVASGTALPDGNTIDWGSNTTLNPSNDGGDYWSIDFQIPDNEQLDFKFYFQQSEDAGLGGYEDGGNHVIEAGTGDVTLDLHYFEKGADKAYDWRPFTPAAADEINVWFRVYMLTEDAVGKDYDRNDDALLVGARGNFGTRGAVDADGPITDWGSGTDDQQIVTLTRESGDDSRPGYDLYSGLVTYPDSVAGKSANYKFYFRDSDTTGDAGYESGSDRSFTIPAAGTDTTLHWVYYSNSPATDPPNNENEVTREIGFGVDVSPVNDVGLFATSDDKILIRGQVVATGWDDCTGGDNPTDGCVLTRDPGTLEYFSAQSVTGEPGEVFEYKYFVDFNEPDGTPQYEDNAENEIVLGWEEPLDFGGGNRRYAFSGQDETRPTEFFNSIRPGNVIPEGTTVDVTFSVFMGRAMNGDLFSRTFDPATDSVTVQFEDPLWLITQGYEAVDDRITVLNSNRLINGFKLEDPDGDLVYTGTLTVAGPTYNAIAYRYLFANGTDGAYVEGSGGEGAEGRRRYRYITDTSTGAFDFALDAFRRGSTEPSGAEDTPWEYNPTGPYSAENNPFDFENAIAVGADDPLGLAVANEGPVEGASLALGRVHPNPTAGSARVQVDAPAGSFVTVRVYDVTGRMVRTVVEDAAVAGRALDIDTAGLASGLYLVRAQAGGASATARFTVVR